MFVEHIDDRIIRFEANFVCKGAGLYVAYIVDCAAELRDRGEGQ